MSSDIKKNMTDKERLELAVKLDRELEEFIDGLEKKRYSEGWPEDRWEEEMDKHPFFMKQAPAPGEELSPLAIGLQELKFDKGLNSPDELAQKYKDDGNFEFQHKNYRLAVINYTEGIKQKSKDNELNAMIYNNRSAAHFYLKNFRSSLNDCLSCLKLNPNYRKAKKRSIDCAFNLKDFEQCIKLCDEYLRDQQDDSILNMRIKAMESKNKLERDKRKKAVLTKKIEISIGTTLKALNNRNIKFFDRKLFCGDLKQIPQPKFEPLLNHSITVKDNILYWPILFLYPEFLTSDCLQEVSELSCINDCLEQIFTEPPEWDINKVYKPDNVNLYFENRYLGAVFLVKNDIEFKNIVVIKNFIVYDGTLTFYVVPKNSKVENEFINQPRVKMAP